MCVYISDTSSYQSTFFYGLHYFIVRGNRTKGQIFKKTEYFSPILQAPTSQFPDDHWMGRYGFVIEKLLQFRISISKMVNPYRSVDQNHPASERLRAGT